MYDFDSLKEWCGLELDNKCKKKHWFWILKRNFKPQQTRNFIRLLRRYGQKQLDEDPKIIIDTIHSVKGDEADNVILYSKGNYPANFRTKNKDGKINEKESLVYRCYKSKKIFTFVKN